MGGHFMDAKRSNMRYGGVNLFYVSRFPPRLVTETTVFPRLFCEFGTQKVRFLSATVPSQCRGVYPLQVYLSWQIAALTRQAVKQRFFLDTSKRSHLQGFAVCPRTSILNSQIQFIPTLFFFKIYIIQLNIPQNVRLNYLSNLLEKQYNSTLQ